MLTRRVLSPLVVGFALSVGALGCGGGTPDPNDPSNEPKNPQDKPKEAGPDAALLAEIGQLNALLSTIGKDDPGYPKALDRLGEALGELSKNHRDRAIAADPNAATVATPPEPKVEGEGPAKPQKGLPARPEGALKKLKPEAAQQLGVADKMAAEAVKADRKLIDDYPDYKDLDRVLFRLARLYVLYGQGAQARPAYFQLIEKYPRSPLVPEAYWNFAEFFFAAEDYDNAYKLYQKVVEYPPTERTGVAGYRLALSLHKLSRLDESWKALEAAASAARIHGPQATVDDIYRDAPKLAATRKPLSARDAAAFFVRLAESNEDVIKQELNRLAQILEDEARPLEATEVMHAMSDRYPEEKCAIQARAIEIATRSGNNAIRADEVKRSLRLGCKP